MCSKCSFLEAIKMKVHGAMDMDTWSHMTSLSPPGIHRCCTQLPLEINGCMRICNGTCVQAYDPGHRQCTSVCKYVFTQVLLYTRVQPFIFICSNVVCNACWFWVGKIWLHFTSCLVYSHCLGSCFEISLLQRTFKADQCDLDPLTSFNGGQCKLQWNWKKKKQLRNPFQSHCDLNHNDLNGSIVSYGVWLFMRFLNCQIASVWIRVYWDFR